MLAISLIVIGILLRFIPHIPNFTPVAAIALFSGCYIKNKKLAVLVPLALMIASDIFVGMHNVIFFTWGAFALITLLGFTLRKHKNALGIISTSLISSIAFYLITNFGVWAMGWYPRTLSGLINCYVMGLPFLRDFALATLAYTTMFVLAYELIAKKVSNTRFAEVLLTK